MFHSFSCILRSTVRLFSTATEMATNYTVSYEAAITDKLHFLNGERIKPTQPSHSVPVYQPGTGEVLVQLQCGGKQDVDRAVEAARKAFPEWSAMSGLERGRVLKNAADIIKANLETLARLEVTNNGKPIYEARIDLEYSAYTFEYYGGLAAGIMGEHIPLPQGNWAYTRREPLGVVGGIGAWNYPFQTTTWKCAPALACGNTFIYKPSPFTPITPVVLAEILTAAGVPKGAIGVLQGEGETGSFLATHPDVNKISFTGSVATGQKIMQMCAEQGLRHVTLELGGKSPLLIFEDVDLDNAVKGAMMANFLTQGEVCSNASRVYVQRNIVDKFTEKVLERTKKLKIGDPLQEDTLIGATINEPHLKKVLSYVESAKQEGAKVLIGGERYQPSDKKSQNGFYMSPCVITDVNEKMKVGREEIFGAVMMIFPFDTEEEVIKRANDTTYGLAAGVFTDNLKRAHRVAAQLQAGSIYINNYNIQPAEVPFGGYKNSGIGRENGPAAIEAYTQVKSVYVEMNNVDSKF